MLGEVPKNPYKKKSTHSREVSLHIGLPQGVVVMGKIQGMENIDGVKNYFLLIVNIPKKIR